MIRFREEAVCSKDLDRRSPCALGFGLLVRNFSLILHPLPPDNSKGKSQKATAVGFTVSCNSYVCAIRRLSDRVEYAEPCFNFSFGNFPETPLCLEGSGLQGPTSSRYSPNTSLNVHTESTSDHHSIYFWVQVWFQMFPFSLTRPINHRIILSFHMILRFLERILNP